MRNYTALKSLEFMKPTRGRRIIASILVSIDKEGKETFIVEEITGRKTYKRLSSAIKYLEKQGYDKNTWGWE